MRSSATGSWPPQKRVIVALGLPLLAGLGVWLLVETDPAGGGLLLPCLFHQLTGLYCIGCGTTRALSALLHGDVAAAFSYNAFMLIWLAWPVWTLLGWWLKALFGRRILPQAREPRWLLILLLISALLFLVLRNLPWPPFTFLAP